MKKPSSIQGLSPSKVLYTIGASLLFQLFCPVMLFAAELFSGGTTEDTPAAIPAALTGNQETLSLAAITFKTLGSLIFVVGLMLLLLFWIKKMGLVKSGFRQEGLITVLDSRMLAPKKQVSILEVAGAYLVVGLTEQQITLLATLEANDLLTAATHSRKTSPPLAASFTSLLNKAAQNISDLKQKKKESANAE